MCKDESALKQLGPGAGEARGALQQPGSPTPTRPMLLHLGWAPQLRGASYRQEVGPELLEGRRKGHFLQHASISPPELQLGAATPGPMDPWFPP